MLGRYVDRYLSRVGIDLSIVISRSSSFAWEDVSVQINSYSEMFEKHLRQEDVCWTQNKIEDRLCSTSSYFDMI